MNTVGEFNLNRFIEAQNFCYENVISELKAGKKSSHWMWFIFPQLAGLGSSAEAEKFAIANEQEAIEYLNHPILSERLSQCIEIVLKHSQLSIEQIFGYPDYLKFKSCITLFYLTSRDKDLFMRALDTFYHGELDEKTIKLLKKK